MHISWVMSFNEGKYSVHESLKGWWRVCESEKHNFGFEDTIRGFENHFPLIFLVYLDVVISPGDV